MEKALFIYANPNFDIRWECGISELYQIFFKKFGYKIEIIDDEFLKTDMPKKNSTRTLVIAGGDGTIHRAINIIPAKAFENYIFGIIPGGTANEFAKSLNLPLEIYAAAEVIAKQKYIKTRKPGIINSQYKFATGFLYGIACKVLTETPQEAKYYFGHYAYQLPGFFSIMNYRDFIKQFTIDSTSFSTGYLLINTASLVSKGVFPEQLKQEDKNRFSIVYISPELAMGDILRLIFKNQSSDDILHDPSVFYQQMNDFLLEFEGKLKFMLDGEDYSLGSPIKFEHSSQEIRIIT